MNRILSPLRKAVDDYGMIEAGDKIAVGVSGGKDSGTLLFALERLRQFYPKSFSLIAVIIDLGTSMNYTPLLEILERNGIPWVQKKTRISELVFDVRTEKNPCSMCAVLRRGALNQTAKEIGANKVALGHHLDDVLETFLLNLIHGGRLGCFQPVTYLDRMDLKVIRPLIYTEEKEIRACVRRLRIPVIENPCPANGNTQRQEMKFLLQTLEQQYPGVRKRIFGAMKRSGLDHW